MKFRQKINCIGSSPLVAGKTREGFPLRVFDRRSVTALVGVVEFLVDRFAWSPFELANRDSLPLFIGSNQRRLDKLQYGPLAEKVGDHLSSRSQPRHRPQHRTPITTTLVINGHNNITYSGLRSHVRVVQSCYRRSGERVVVETHLINASVELIDSADS